MSEIYDPHRLVRDVIDILQARGVDARLESGQLGEAVAGAGMLLRALAVSPALDAVDALERSASRVWADRD